MTEPFDNFSDIVVGPDRFYIESLEMSGSIMPGGHPALILSIVGWKADTGETKTLHFMTSLSDWTTFFAKAHEHFGNNSDSSA